MTALLLSYPQHPKDPDAYDMYGFLHSPVYFDWLNDLALQRGARAMRIHFDRPIKPETPTALRELETSGKFEIIETAHGKALTRFELLAEQKLGLVTPYETWATQSPVIYEGTETNDVGYQTMPASVIVLMVRLRFRVFSRLSGLTLQDLVSKIGVGLVATGFEIGLEGGPLAAGAQLHVRSRVREITKPYSRFVVEYLTESAQGQVSGTHGRRGA